MNIASAAMGIGASLVAWLVVDPAPTGAELIIIAIAAAIWIRGSVV